VPVEMVVAAARARRTWAVGVAPRPQRGKRLIRPYDGPPKNQTRRSCDWSRERRAGPERRWEERSAGLRAR
jgi:hypothetical protein